MSSPLTHGGRGADKAFTLIELLTVIAIIGILAAITFGIGGAAQQRAAVSKAKTELSTLATALESYKRQYGDYPQTGALTLAEPDTSPAIGSIATSHAQSGLFNALAGKFGPKLDPITNGKVFIELAKFTMETTNMPVLTNDVDVANAFVDPWGRRYIYVYKDEGSPSTWKAPSYVLYSAGPDGKRGGSIAGNGSESVSNAAEAADNIYANR